MKKTNIIYWVFTGLFAALMLMSAIQNALSTPEWVAVMAQLGYPKYLLPFLGVAKMLGIAALLIPGFPRLKEWAYAGFAFDLIGVIYSSMSVAPVTYQMLYMLVWIIPGVISYIYHHKRLKARNATAF